MAITLKRGLRVVYTGDSTSKSTPDVTAWWDGGFSAWVASQFTALPAVQYAGTATGVAARATGTVAANAALTPPMDVTSIDGAKNGQTSGGLASEWSTYIGANTPAVLFVAIGTNDVAGSVTPATFEANLTSIVTQTQTAFPAVQIAILSVYFRGEVWNTGPAWNNGAVDAAIDAINAKMALVAAAKGCTYIDTRSQFLTWEAANNPGKAATGIASADGIHFNSTGKAAIDPMVRPSVTISQAYP